MVDFIHKRLQVFVSSTFSDLIPERQAAVEAILTAGHIPAGMELFTSGDESQMDVIKQWIDESDVYLLILGGRYGSIEPKSGKSYTQLEYEYALSQGKPLFSCVIEESAIENRVKAEGTKVIEMQEQQKLRDFRELVLSKIARFWGDAKDIKISIGETLAQFARREDLIGWVRPSDQANMPALADEMARLSRENAELRSQIQARTPDVTIAGLSFTEMMQVLISKNVLEFFIDLSRSEGARQNAITKRETRVLEQLGLVDARGGSTRINFTDDGRLFLNRWEAERLKEPPGKGKSSE